MPIQNSSDYHQLTDHDLLIIVAEHCREFREDIKDVRRRLDESNKVKPRIARLEAIVGILTVLGLGTGIPAGMGVF